MVGGFLYENVSPQAPFYASSALGLLGVIFFALFVREPEREGPEIDPSDES